MKYIKIFILVAAVATLVMPIAGNAEVNQPQKNIKRFCYQGLCLNDPISKLSLSIVASKRESAIDLVKNIAKNDEDMKVASKLFIGDKKDVEILAKRGFISGSPIELDQKTLDALKNIKTICGKVANFAKVRVTASNAKQLFLLYTPMTDEDGISTYGLVAITVPYPEVQSRNEMDDLISKASVAMNVKLNCDNLGTGRSCNDVEGSQEFNIEDGELVIMHSRRNRFDHKFSLNKTRENTLCKSDVNF